MSSGAVHPTKIDHGMTGPAELVHLTGCNPVVLGTEIAGQLTPPPQFAHPRFETYLPVPRNPSQQPSDTPRHHRSRTPGWSLTGQIQGFPHSRQRLPRSGPSPSSGCRDRADSCFVPAQSSAVRSIPVYISTVVLEWAKPTCLPRSGTKHPHQSTLAPSSNTPLWSGLSATTPPCSCFAVPPSCALMSLSWMTRATPCSCRDFSGSSWRAGRGCPRHPIPHRMPSARGDSRPPIFFVRSARSPPILRPFGLMDWTTVAVTVRLTRSAWPPTPMSHARHRCSQSGGTG